MIKKTKKTVVCILHYYSGESETCGEYELQFVSSVLLLCPKKKSKKSNIHLMGFTSHPKVRKCRIMSNS